LTGLWADPATASLPTPILTDLAGPVFVNAGAVIGTYSPIISSPFPGCRQHGVRKGQRHGLEGIIEQYISGRRSTGSLDPEVDDLALSTPGRPGKTQPRPASRPQSATRPATVIRLEIPKAANEDIKYGERNGLATYQQGYVASVDRDGDDEWASLFSKGATRMAFELKPSVSPWQCISRHGRGHRSVLPHGHDQGTAGILQRHHAPGRQKGAHGAKCLSPPSPVREAIRDRVQEGAFTVDGVPISATGRREPLSRVEGSVEGACPDALALVCRAVINAAPRPETWMTAAWSSWRSSTALLPATSTGTSPDATESGPSA
jgi:hypothetical protein